MQWAATKAEPRTLVALMGGYAAVALTIRALGISEIAPALLLLTCIAVPTAL